MTTPVNTHTHTVGRSGYMYAITTTTVTALAAIDLQAMIAAPERHFEHWAR